MSSIRQRRAGPVSVEDPNFPDDGVYGVRHYTGNIAKWTKRNPAEGFQFGVRGGSFFRDDAENFSDRYDVEPGFYSGRVGFLAAASV